MFLSALPMAEIVNWFFIKCLGVILLVGNVMLNLCLNSKKCDIVLH